MQILWPGKFRCLMRKTLKMHQRLLRFHLAMFWCFCCKPFECLMNSRDQWCHRKLCVFCGVSCYVSLNTVVILKQTNVLLHHLCHTCGVKLLIFTKSAVHLLFAGFFSSTQQLRHRHANSWQQETQAETPKSPLCSSVWPFSMTSMFTVFSWSLQMWCRGCVYSDVRADWLLFLLCDWLSDV